MRCPYCNQTHPDNAKFCPKTGIPFAQPSIQRKKWGLTFFLVTGGLIAIGLVLFLIVPGLLPQDAADIESRKISLLDPAAAGEKDFGTGALVPDAQATTASPIRNTPANTSSPIPSSTATSPATPLPSETAAPTATLTSTRIASEMNPKDGAAMVYVPEGQFLMGSDPGSDPYFWGAEAPSHEVQLDSFWIYQAEVTNAMYQACTAQRACPIPEMNQSRTRDSYYDNAEYANYPVIYVDWTSAQSYCVWAGGSLPSEAQWEKASRGTDGRLFPWEGQFNDLFANLCDVNCPNDQQERNIDDGYRDTAPVGSYPDGISPYGAYDMAGNVWEWVYDWFQETYYQVSPLENPPGPASSKYRVTRGGAFINPLGGIRTVARYAVRPDLALDTLGFRCALEELH